MATRILTRAEVEALLEMPGAIDAVQRAFVAHGRGETLMPVKVYLPLEDFEGDFRAMPAYFDGSAGVKWVNSHPRNPSRHGLPAVLGLYVLSDPETALPLAILDATWLTAVRTGAAAAVATRALARPDVQTVGFVGCGVQARTLHEALRVVLCDFESVAADLDPKAAERFAGEVGGRAATIEHAASCDVVCTATPSRDPVIRRSWVRPGTHINAMGADAPGKQELETSLVLDARVVVDDWEQGCESGEVNVPLETGRLHTDDLHASLGEILAGLRPGREGDEITIFDSTGLAVQDVALARLAFVRSVAVEVGVEIDLVGVDAR